MESRLVRCGKGGYTGKLREILSHKAGACDTFRPPMDVSRGRNHSGLLPKVLNS